jgi:hypothetical protein
VRAMDVVVVGVLAQDQLQVPLAGDQHPVQALAPGAGDPALRDCVRPGRPDRSPDDPPRADRGEHGVERSGELGVPVMDQELEAVSAALEVHQEVTGLLGHPLPRRMGGDPGQVHAPGPMLDEEQHIQTAQEHGIDVEEIRREDRLGLGFQERLPGLPGPPGCGIDARVLEDLPYRRRREHVAQSGQLTVDAPVPPGRVVPGHLQDQRPHGRRGPGPSRTAARIRPVPPDQIGVPAQQGPRRDDQAQLTQIAPGQQPGQRGQDRPVSPRQAWRLDLALENGDLVTQQEDLGVLGAVGAGEQGKPAEHAEHRQVGKT